MEVTKKRSRNSEEEGQGKKRRWSDGDLEEKKKSLVKKKTSEDGGSKRRRRERELEEKKKSPKERKTSGDRSNNRRGDGDLEDKKKSLVKKKTSEDGGRRRSEGQIEERKSSIQRKNCGDWSNNRRSEGELEDQKKSQMKKISVDGGSKRRRREGQVKEKEKSPMERKTSEDGRNKRRRSGDDLEEKKKHPMEKKTRQDGSNKSRRSKLKDKEKSPIEKSEKLQLEEKKSQLEKTSEGLNKDQKSRSPEDPLEGGSAAKKLCVDISRPVPLDIKNYRFYSELGKGGFGRVMLASFTPKKQLVAVKIMQKSPDKNNFNIMMKEARVLSVARGSTFLCHSYAAFQSELESFFVLEYASGKSLMQMILRKGNLPMARIMFYTAEMVVALQFLHSKGIIHRDLKPDNVLVDRYGHIKICDFGLAAENIFDQTRTNGVIGTPGYRAPEVLSKAEYNAGVDWWSFGITMYQMATGSLPFSPSGSILRQFFAIKKNTPYYPYYMSKEMLDLLPKLLEMDENQRIGVNGNIREHAFYSTVKWEELENRRVKTPFQPGMPSADDFTEIPLSFSSQIRNEETNLADFSHVDPSWSWQE
ncbi:protein kinase C delta type-like [Xenopus laevis]|uniref:Protein kinase C delta type-like n=6 Tax=Xenopus laevis TaxID=8355 RepID=A0A8J1M998_XENLA|nr:protein kinase C delta type-like [Xenopus laevis]XP_041437626.1 protein kinase C delta type-like [Xenopus laevis]XP_041437627.1 protein kinase C delta type-like [Xenopus laevis]